MCRRAVETEEDTVGSGCPSRTCVGTIEAYGVGGDVFEFTKLSVFEGGGDGDLVFPRGGDGAVGFDVA